MTSQEFDNQFDVYYNNITSNQAPGLNTYEKCVFLTRAEIEIVKNHFSANSKGNNLQQGFDDSAKRQADFSCLMKTGTCDIVDAADLTAFDLIKIDDRSDLYAFPSDVFIVINEAIKTSSDGILQVIPLRYDEYTRLMSKPFKRPLKNQAWRLINSSVGENNDISKYVEILLPNKNTNVATGGYKIRYIRMPKPIIIGSLDNLTIGGYHHISDIEEESGASNNSEQINGEEIPSTDGCELDPILHEEILQRAVELAKIAWTATGQENTEAVLVAGQRSE